MLLLRKTQELTLRNLSARLSTAGRNYSKKQDSSSDDEKQGAKYKREKVEPTKTDESASSKLNRLLASMQTDDQRQLKTAKVVPIPGEANKKRKLDAKKAAESKDIFAAAKKVAAYMGEENKLQTESELLSKLLGNNQTTSNNIASNETNVNASDNQSADISLSDLIVGMKIDRRAPQKHTNSTSRSEYVRRSMQQAKGKYQNQSRQRDSSGERRPAQRKREAEVFTGSVNLFSGEQPLGIFDDASQLYDSKDLLPTWSYLQQESLKLQVSHPPSNYFEKIALWTEQGKTWRFPIDNEQDWSEEIDVDFSEHIFLDQHLEDWCPNRGPVRHFMELVCVGLSKNPYITAKEKKEHILWYRDYFLTKKDILRELMAKEPKLETASVNKTELSS